jgi:RimJ/RimL family protein N-acetyltransferase
MLPEELVSPRLRLRPPRQDDAAAMFEAWTRDPDVTRYLTWRPHGKPDQTATFVAGCIEAWRGPSRRPWVITRFGENVPIGLIELRLDGHRAELGYVLARSAWGQGYMTEAVQTVVHAAFDELPLSRVSAVCDVDNLASARVLDKAGLQREGVLRRYIMHPNISDEPRNVYLFARTRPVRGSMSAGDVLVVLAALAERHVPVWVGGGWGIDALLGDQTREHTDLDLAIRAEQEAEVIEILTALGYRIVLDYRPSRLAMADDDGHEVDLHPVRFDMLGNGVQPGLHGPVFHYPREGFAHGRIAGQPVACLSAERQASFHTGYPLRAKERQDLERLRARFGTAVPTSSSD